MLYPVSSYASLSLYIGTCLILAVFSILLPIETKGRSLKVYTDLIMVSTFACYIAGYERIELFIF